MKQAMAAIGICATALAAGAASGQGVGTVTAEFLGPGNGLAGSAGERNRFGQSFLATVGGEIESIDLSIRRNGADPATVIVTVFETAPNGVPAGTALGSAQLPVTLTPDFEWYTVDFSGAGVSLAEGVSYALIVSSISGDGGYLLETARPGGYADGTGLVSLAGGPIEPMANNFIYGDRDVLFVVRTASDACLPDANGDGALTPGDFNAWILAFNAQSAACDQNGDGQCTPGDFNAWVLNFNAGC
ncbi:MAG: GC-type dockerin domain-anchored protein [Planctomycetota bacterium]